MRRAGAGGAAAGVTRLGWRMSARPWAARLPGRGAAARDGARARRRGTAPALATAPTRPAPPTGRLLRRRMRRRRHPRRRRLGAQRALRCSQSLRPCRGPRPGRRLERRERLVEASLVLLERRLGWRRRGAGPGGLGREGADHRSRAVRRETGLLAPGGRRERGESGLAGRRLASFRPPRFPAAPQARLEAHAGMGEGSDGDDSPAGLVVMGLLDLVRVEGGPARRASLLAPARSGHRRSRSRRPRWWRGWRPRRSRSRSAPRADPRRRRSAS